MKLKDLIGDTLVIGMSVALLWHFLNIWLYGQYLAGEPNMLIRSLETAGLLIILVFGTAKFVTDLKR